MLGGWLASSPQPAASIGENNVSSLGENYNDNHSRVKMIRTAYNETRFDFNIFCNEQGQDALANINPRKSFGWDTAYETSHEGV